MQADRRSEGAAGPIPGGERGHGGPRAPLAASRREAALCYALGAFSGIVLLVLRREDRYVQFHALQSILATVVGLAVAAVLWILSFFPLLGFLYGMLFVVYQIALFLLWLFLLWQAYRGRWYRIPHIGVWAEKQIL